MNKEVEGIYPSFDEALRAVDRLKVKGYSRDQITLVANEEVRERIQSIVDDGVVTQEVDTMQTDEKERSLWEKINDAFTIDDSYDGSNEADNNPIYEYRNLIAEGQIVVLVNKETDSETTRNKATTEPNTVGPEGTRDFEDEQKLRQTGIDRELTTHELDDYERKQ